MKKRRTLACQCGHVADTWFDKHLKKDVCASCVEPRSKAVKKSKPPKCKCGASVGLWFSERLSRYVCSPCLEKEIVTLMKRLRLVERKAKAGKD